LERQGKFGALSIQQEHILRRILRGTLKSRSIINMLLEIGRSEAEQFVVSTFLSRKVICTALLDILEMMDSGLFTQVIEKHTEQDVLTALASAGIVVHMLPEEDIEVIQDQTKFSQIVGNLIKNALRFRRERVDVRMYRDGERLLVDISDDGPGIKPENHALIFQRYAQIDAEGALARKGHGLGLAGALILARRLGGNITVQSDAGKGATFRFMVPVKIAIKTPTKGE
jgi:two-component system, OmpR family, sensor kinase